MATVIAPSQGSLLGTAFLVTFMSLELEPQAPLVIVQRKVLVPVLKPLTVVFGSLALANEPEPPTTDQLPEPLLGVLAAKVTLELHVV